MAAIAGVIAQFGINFAADALLPEAFGVDLSSFAVLTPNTNYQIQFDPDFLPANEQIVVEYSFIGGPEATRPLLINNLPNPLFGLDITSFGYDGLAPAASTAISVRFTVRRFASSPVTPS